MSLLGRRLINPIVPEEKEIYPAMEGYGFEQYGLITLQEDNYMDQLSLMESFHEFDSIEDAFYADKAILESVGADEEQVSEREALFESDTKEAGNKTLAKLKTMVENVVRKIKSLYNSLLNQLIARLGTAKEVVAKMGEKVSDGSVEIETYNYGDLSFNNPKIKALNALQINMVLNSLIGGNLSSICSSDDKEKIVDATAKLRDKMNAMGPFDQNAKDEIYNAFKGQKVKKSYKGSDAIKVLNQNKVIMDMKKQIQEFSKQGEQVISEIKKISTGNCPHPAEVGFLGRAYLDAFTSQAQHCISAARIVINIAQDQYSEAVRVIKLIARQKEENKED